MERLTKQGQDFENQFCDEVNCQFYGEPNGCNNPNYSCSSFCYFTSVAEMLEKYEDTELTPDLIEAMRGHNYELINQNADLQAENAELKARLEKAVEFVDWVNSQFGYCMPNEFVSRYNEMKGGAL